MFQHLLWNSPALIPVSIGICMLVVAAVFWSYRGQMQTLRSPWRWLMPSLRGIALVIVAISIVRPVIVRAKAAGDRGAVVLLIDRSRSMGIVDTGRDEPALVALADGLRMLPKGIRPKSNAKLEEAPEEQAQLLNDLYLARGQLDYARIAGQDTEKAEEQLEEIAGRFEMFAEQLEDYPQAQRPAQQLADLASESETSADEWARKVGALGIDLSKAISDARSFADGALYRANDQVRQACDELAAATRLAIVERSLVSPELNLLKHLLDGSAVFGFTFADDTTPIPLEDSRGALKALSLEPGGMKSDLTAALRGVREAMRGQPVQAIVLFSDGRQSGGAELGQVLPTIAPPVFAVNAAGPVKRDLSLTRLVAPASAYMGQIASVRADLRGIGVAGVTIEVQLDTGDEHQVQKVTLADNRSASVEFTHRFNHPGEQTITVAITPQPGETTSENNRISKRINVLADKVKVLAITSWPGWEFQMMRSALAASPFIEMRTQIVTADAPKLAETPDTIGQRDVVLLCDIRADVMSPDQWTAIAKLVRERGGSVIFIANEAKNLVDFSHQPGIAELLPFRDMPDAAWRVWPGEDPYFHLTPAPGEEDSDALRLAEDLGTNARRWSNLGGMFRFMPVTDERADVEPLLIEPDSELPVLTQMRVGAGRSFFFGARETWRWRYKVGGRDHERFWLQLVRFAAKQREAAGDAQVTQEPLNELANVSGDEGRLRRIASSTGGEVVPIEDVASLPVRIRAAGEKQPGFLDYSVWDSGYLFALVVGCLGLEWALRKRAGLI